MGVIGMGSAWLTFMPTLAQSPRVQIIAGADPRSAARRKFAADFSAEVFESAEALCASPAVEAVYVATPHRLHAHHVIAAAENGKHAICEKPMALTLDECDAMIAAVERAGTHLVVGPSQGFSPPILKIREMVKSEQFGTLGMVNTWAYKDFVYRARSLEELDPALGGSSVLNQGPHQVDVVRWIGGGLVRSVRAMVGMWDTSRPIDGAHAAFLEFEDGAAATLAFSGYGRFDTDELHDWVGEGGQQRPAGIYGNQRNRLVHMTAAEVAAAKASSIYGGGRERAVELNGGPPFHPHFGTTIVSCQHADLRPSPTGVTIYDDGGRREIPIPVGPTAQSGVVDELYQAVREGRPTLHDGRWGKATLEVLLAILQSSRERREVFLSHQVPTAD
ncbi:MAG: Gfo/Idh/MocA family oxidoreductase [Chloroflexi bacterium]|nr:Gfo/Idh/MocA family oxidoreductase [Chloroflexota bacterium]